MLINTNMSWPTRRRIATEFNIDCWDFSLKIMEISSLSATEINQFLHGAERVPLYLQISNRHFLILENSTWELIIVPRKNWWSSLKRLPQTATNFLTALTLQMKRVPN